MIPRAGLPFWRTFTAPFGRGRQPAVARQLVNEAGFEVGVTMSPEEADRLGLKPFGDGGAANESTPKRPKLYTHGPCASPAAAQFVVPCLGFEDAHEAERRRLAREALRRMRDNGFVVLESLLPQEWVRKLEAEAQSFLSLPQPGLIPQPLRAGRTEGHLSFTAPWASDWLLKNELVLEVIAGYMNNNLAAGRTQEEQQWSLVQWLTSGAHLEWFELCGPKPGQLLETPPPGCSDVGTQDETGPFFGRISLIHTPPGAEPQKHHRDINFPGPAAQVTAQVALTPLEANNGPLAYVPGSHRMLTPGFEVVANPPLGSVVLYDSFCEHRGIEHHGHRDRYAMYYEFETRGVFSGYTATHFGPESESHMQAFRGFVDPELRAWVGRNVSLALFPSVTFRNVTLQVNFSPALLRPLPFKCHTWAQAAKAHAEAKPSAEPKDGKYEVVLPVGLPDEGTFDWVDQFLAKNKNYTELSDRAILDWAMKSGLQRSGGYLRRRSNDSPEMSFGLPLMEDYSISQAWHLDLKIGL
ncbi:unnamed protein product [Effrenium voratum]|uniref:Uncharacterized protein n=1 Tax=Effrenium voratum TaxID=2562239 RepID=A0AA36J3R4_9DINO|nr:unnamed protein product [Effrenium voratum]